MKKKGNLDFHLEQALTFRRLFLDLLNETFIPPNTLNTITLTLFQPTNNAMKQPGQTQIAL
jgi:hypothetical protein